MSAGARLGLLLLLLFAPSRAAAQPLLRVELFGELEPALLVRLMGQIDELGAWRIVRIEEPPPAESALRDRDADAVVWVTGDGEVVSVWVADPHHGRLYVEQLAHGDDASARYEAITIAVRTALEALGAAGVIGIAIPVSVEPDDADAEPDAEEPAEDAREPAQGVRLLGTLAGTLGVDGLAAPHGVALGLGLAVGAWTLELSARVGLPHRIEGEQVALSLEHHRVAVGAALSVVQTPWIRFSLVLDVGAWLVNRSTVAVVAGLRPTAPSLAVSASIGASARTVMWVAPAVGVVLDLGAELLLPTIRYSVDGMGVLESWPVLLRGLVGLVLEAG